MGRNCKLLAGLFLAASSLASGAGSSSGVFQVAIQLGAVDALCVSQTLSDQTGATVRVVCNTEQFVDINPTPGQPFLGTHGGAFRYAFSRGAWGLTLYRLENSHDLLGSGTTSSTRILGPSTGGGTLEMLVSF